MKAVNPISEQSVTGSSKEHVAWESWHGNWLSKMIVYQEDRRNRKGHSGLQAEGGRQGGGMVYRGNCK